ncbi:protein-L-isoaspartate(D-aspartate) O-methyltransferase [Methyloterricola oryzae]|uniref:protein-L-isoaspartate(D-aspartate) O-methyltransferase n=1 Tax=Methyloterricola oryzae TaxID=1495050 RepID=UPI0005EAF5EC|nr:protein-L-isoaspartate(D-aspartate) O-methyltransferase [Methyloterricola oryzae]
MNDMTRMMLDIDAEMKLTRPYTGMEALAPRVIQAIRQVPRDQFLPEETRAYAFYDGPVPIGFGQTISQPFIVALMTDLLQPEPEHSVLEIGTGSCYQAAVLSLLVRQVYSVEIIPELARQARERLDGLGYRNVSACLGDGYYGWPEHAPYDGIIVTAAAPEVPEPLLEQLKPGGRLVIPIGPPYQYQELRLIEKAEDGSYASRKILGVAFVPLTGQHPFAKPETLGGP